MVDFASQMPDFASQITVSLPLKESGTCIIHCCSDIL